MYINNLTKLWVNLSLKNTVPKPFMSFLTRKILFKYFCSKLLLKQTNKQKKKAVMSDLVTYYLCPPYVSFVNSRSTN